MRLKSDKEKERTAFLRVESAVRAEEEGVTVVKPLQTVPEGLADSTAKYNVLET